MTSEAVTGPPSHANWFFGLPIGGAFLKDLPPPPRGFRLFTSRDVHLTVAFLGPCGRELAERALAALDETLLSARLESLEYALGEVIPLGNPRRYSALSATLTTGHDQASAIIGALRDPLVAAAEARPDTRPPLPHATIARPRRRAGNDERRAGLSWARGLDLSEVRGTIDRVALYTWPEERRESLFQVVAERALARSGPRVQAP
jgi:RNA 2',3'-cyclic 3'-phosphodiesterase